MKQRVKYRYRSKESKVLEMERGRFFSCYSEATSTEEKDKCWKNNMEGNMAGTLMKFIQNL